MDSQKGFAHIDGRWHHIHLWRQILHIETWTKTCMDSSHKVKSDLGIFTKTFSSKMPVCSSFTIQKLPGIRDSILSILSRMLACQEFQWNSCLSFLTLTLCKKIGFWPSCWPIFLVAADGYVHSNFYSSLEFILWWPKSYNSISFLTWHHYFLKQKCTAN